MHISIVFFVNDDISSRHYDEFQIKPKRTCQPFKVFMVKINFTIISIKSNTKFKNEIISSKGKNRRKLKNSYYDNLTKKLTKTSLKI